MECVMYNVDYYGHFLVRRKHLRIRGKDDFKYLLTNADYFEYLWESQNII